MDEVQIPKYVRRIAEKGRIEESDVLELRRRFFDEGSVTTAEADAMFWLNDATVGNCAQWNDFFVEALTDFYVNQRRPSGYIDDDGADEIAHRILKDGRIRSASEFELLASIVETAISVPNKLILFALGEVRVAVVEGEGPLRGGVRLEPGVIADAEVDLLRRFIYGIGSDGNIKVTKLEADLLFDLNDSIVGAESHEAWADLFVNAIANYVMAAQLWAPVPVAEAARRESWLERREGALGFMKRLADSGVGGALDALKADADSEAAMRRAAREEEIADAEMITAEEAEWLASRLERDGVINDNELAILDRLKAEADNLHPALRRVIERAA